MKRPEFQPISQIDEYYANHCHEHDYHLPCPECSERDEAAAYWYRNKRADREALDLYCEVYDKESLFDDPCADDTTDPDYSPEE